MPGPAEPPFRLGPQRTGLHDPRARLRACLEHAHHFIRTATADTVLRQVFTSANHRDTIRAMVTSDVHVGFMMPDSLAALREQGDVIQAAGFQPDWRRSTSTVLARELAASSGGQVVPTTIITLRPLDSSSDASYAELFLPEAGRALVPWWFAQEVATHVGWQVDRPGGCAPVQAAFAAEGFVVPPCVQGPQDRRGEHDLDMLYFDRGAGATRTRIELLHPQRAGTLHPMPQPGDAPHA